jgi:hypothetical protein
MGNTNTQTKETQMKKRMVEMMAKFPGKCGICEDHISVGMEIYWSKNTGAFHRECWEADQTEEFFAGRDNDLECDEPADTCESEATAMMAQDTYEVDDCGYDPRDAEYETYFND